MPKLLRNGSPFAKEILAVGMNAQETTSNPALRRQELHAQNPARNFRLCCESHQGLFSDLAANWPELYGTRRSENGEDAFRDSSFGREM